MLLRSYSFILIANIFWALNPVATKTVFAELPIIIYLFHRALLAGTILLIMSYLMGYRYKFKEIGWKPFILGMLDPGLTSFIYCMSLTVLSASNAILVMALMPFSQSIMGKVVFKEEFKTSILWGAMLSIIGIGIFLSGEQLDGATSIWGNLLLLLVFLIMMISQLLTRSIMTTNKPVMQVTSIQMIGATFTMAIIMLISGETTLPAQISQETWITFIYLVFSLAMPFLFYNVALKKIPVAMVSLMLVLIIPFGFLFATIFLGEELSWLKVVGAVFVMSGVAFPLLPQIRFSALRANNRLINE